MDDKEINQACIMLLTNIAGVSERLNDFARKLRASAFFSEVIAGSNIRCYGNGWMIEKYVEAKLKNDDSQFAVWWLELSHDGDQWKIDTSTDITNGDYRNDFKPFFAANLTDFFSQLKLSVEQLENSFNPSSPFHKAILNEVGSSK